METAYNAEEDALYVQVRTRDSGRQFEVRVKDPFGFEDKSGVTHDAAAFRYPQDFTHAAKQYEGPPKGKYRIRLYAVVAVGEIVQVRRVATERPMVPDAQSSNPATSSKDQT
jgi:hypothetical protein